MATIEVTTKTRILKSGESELVMRVSFLPRGSGNRNKARRLGEAFQVHDRMSKHIKRVVVGASSVTVHMQASVSLAMDLMRLQLEKWVEKSNQVEGQMGLFGEADPAVS